MERTWPYKETWNFLASSNWDISSLRAEAVCITSGEPAICKNLGRNKIIFVSENKSAEMKETKEVSIQVNNERKY